jgi:hypothetical protein
MAFPTSTSDILATTIESRSRKVADNVTKNNALLTRLNQRGNIKTVSGGSLILEEISFAENGNGSWYSGYDLLPVAAQDVISAAQFYIKQIAVPVVISGLEQLQNSGREQMIDLMSSRLDVAEGTMSNLIAQGLYGDGTGYGGKTIVGLEAAVPYTNTNTYGGIDRSTWTFWKNQIETKAGGLTATITQTAMNEMWSKLVRGSDRPDLIIATNTMWAAYMASLQAIQRFTDPSSADLGFPSIKFMDADVVLDGGIGGFGVDSATSAFTSMYFLNTKYLKFRPHKDRNMVALNPTRRYSVNQDAEVQILAWAGALTCSGAQFQGRLQITT